MKWHIDPAMHLWAARLPDEGLLAAGQPRQRGNRLLTTSQPIIATGHQAGLWHPGILAKCIAAKAHAKAVGGQAVYVLVDHDDNDSMRLQLPVMDQNKLTTHTIHLADSLPGVALIMQPRIDWQQAHQKLREVHDRLGNNLRVNLQPLFDAIRAMQELDTITPTRAHQWQAFLQQLWRPYLGDLPIVLATDHVDHALVDRMLHDAARCVACYNAAVHEHPQAGVLPLVVERDRLELPLWYIGSPRDPQPRPKPRQRIYADLADASPLLVLEDGEPVARDGDRHLGIAPRALALTAMLRSVSCDLFIHGQGGGIYDLAMQDWWQAWIGSPLAPMAVVSADVHLKLRDVALADQAQLTRAIWYAHHLTHNLDRHLPAGFIDAAKADRKRELLAHMNDDLNPKRRAAAFGELHQINDALANEHAAVLALAAKQRQHAEIGVINRAIALKRDWCFAMYEPGQIEEMCSEMDQLAAPV